MTTPTDRTPNEPASRVSPDESKHDVPSPGGVEGVGADRSHDDARKRSPDAASAHDDTTTAPVSGGGMAGTGAPPRSRSHSGTSTTPGAGPNPTGSR